jgi:hypothetical protein
MGKGNVVRRLQTPQGLPRRLDTSVAVVNGKAGFLLY